MTRLSKAMLLERVLDGIAEGGWQYVVEASAHPFELVLWNDSSRMSVRVYIWNITHGGGPARAANEYRIQITSGVSHFVTTGVDRTLILGYWGNGEAFAGWDVKKHGGRLGSSPSLQISEETLLAAESETLATQRKGNDEIAVAFKPSFIPVYAEFLTSLHSLATSPHDLRILQEIASNPAHADEQIALVSRQRRVVIGKVARRLRDTGFTRRVMSAYANRCCMCGVQLRLVEAAHIVPVASADNDATSNGLALCALHHRAFDRALLTITEDYRVALNPQRLEHLSERALDAGLGRFMGSLRTTISLPPDRRDRPDPRLIRKGNRLRGWEQMRPVR